MKNTFSSQQISRTSNLDANLKSRQYELSLMVDFLRVKYEKPKLKQSEILNQLGLSTSTLQRYRNDINMLSPYSIHPNNTNRGTKTARNTNFDNNSHHEHDLKMTSSDLKTTSNEPVKNKRNKLKCGDPSNDNTTQGSILIEQVFSSNY